MRRTAASCIALVLCTTAFTVARAQPGALRVCAEPASFPVSDRRKNGFENRIAQLVADDLGLTLEYTWHPQWRGFVRKTLGADRCDVWLGVPAEFERVLTTRPYYRSSYVFVSDAATTPITDFSDPRLRDLPVGVPRIAGDVTTTPAGLALAPAGPAPNVIGYSVYDAVPASARIVSDVETGRLAVGVLWGPQAGYYAKHAGRPLRVAIADPPPQLRHLPFEYDIAMGVRQGERALRDRLDEVLARRSADIDAILDEYAVPRSDRRRAVR